MSDNPLDRLPAYDRVSIRAVLVHDGEDPSAALAEAGIFDPIAIPVILGDGGGVSGPLLGDGITPNLMAVLETARTGGFAAGRGDRRESGTAAQPGIRPTVLIKTVTSPPAFGRRSWAPIQRLDGSGGNPAPRPGRFVHGGDGVPPVPSLFASASPANWRNFRPYLEGVSSGRREANPDSASTRDGPTPSERVGSIAENKPPVYVGSNTIKPASSQLTEGTDARTAAAAGTDNRLGPDPDATGPHSTYRVAPDGTIQHYQTYEEKPVTKTYDPVPRFRGAGKSHGTVEPPFILERPAGKGPGSTPSVVRPALPSEIPATIAPRPAPVSDVAVPELPEVIIPRIFLP